MRASMSPKPRELARPIGIGQSTLSFTVKAKHKKAKVENADAEALVMAMPESQADDEQDIGAVSLATMLHEDCAPRVQRLPPLPKLARTYVPLALECSKLVGRVACRLLLSRVVNSQAQPINTLFCLGGGRAQPIISLKECAGLSPEEKAASSNAISAPSALMEKDASSNVESSTAKEILAPCALEEKGASSIAEPSAAVEKDASSFGEQCALVTKDASTMQNLMQES